MGRTSRQELSTSPSPGTSWSTTRGHRAFISHLTTMHLTGGLRLSRRTMAQFSKKPAPVAPLLEAVAVRSHEPYGNDSAMVEAKRRRFPRPVQACLGRGV